MEFLKIFSYDLYFSGNSSLFSIFLIINGLIFNLCAKSSIDRPFSNLASLIEDELFKETIYLIEMLDVASEQQYQ